MDHYRLGIGPPLEQKQWVLGHSKAVDSALVIKLCTLQGTLDINGRPSGGIERGGENHLMHICTIVP